MAADLLDEGIDEVTTFIGKEEGGPAQGIDLDDVAGDFGKAVEALCKFPPLDRLFGVDLIELTSCESVQKSPSIRPITFHGGFSLLRRILNTCFSGPAAIVELPSPRPIETPNFAQRHLMRSPPCPCR